MTIDTSIQKILLVGSVRHTVSPWILLWAKNFRELGFDVRIFDQRKATRPLGINFKEIFPKLHYSLIKIVNKKLLRLVKDWKPDLLFCIKGDLIEPSTIIYIRRMNVITLLWSPDDPYLFHTLAKNIAPSYDFIVTSAERCIPWYRDIGCKHVVYLPFMCDPDIHKKIALSEDEMKYYGADICFVGSYSPEREYYFEVLSGYDFKIFGSGWHKAKGEIKNNWMGRSLSIFELVKAYNASEIILNHHYTMVRYLGGINMRVFEVTGCGAFLLTDMTEVLPKHFLPNKEVAVYNNREELKEKVDYYLDNPEERKKIAYKGQEKAYKEHTYKKRIEELLNFIKEGLF